MNSYNIIQGNALDVLKTLEENSIQCVICSPPYYGLRSYGTDPIVWSNHVYKIAASSDRTSIRRVFEQNDCSHQWKGETTLRPNASGGTSRNKGEKIHFAQNIVDYTDRATYSDFCLSCNAWRGELGLEPTFQLYISHLIEIFAEVKRVLKKDGTCFVNLGDSYGTNSGNSRQMQNGNGGKSKESVQTRYSNPFVEMPKALHKSLLNIPARFAIAMTDELQMIQRNELVWHKPACMPSSATDRWTVDFEPIYFFAKSPKYKFNQQLEPISQASISRNQYGENGNGDYAVNRSRQPGEFVNPEGRNARTVRKVNFEPQSDEHYASYPTKLVEPFILAGTDEGDTVLDIFAGTGTTLLTALRHRRNALGIELQPKYIEIANKRLAEVQVNLF